MPETCFKRLTWGFQGCRFRISYFQMYILTIKNRLIYMYILTIKTRLIYIYICNELIEETAGHRKLIFGMWESFGYGSSKF